MTAALALAALALVLGLGLVALELVVPSFGALGLIAGVCLIGSVVLAFKEGSTWGWIFVAGVVIGVPLTLKAAAGALPHTPIGKRMILSGPVTEGHGGAVPGEQLAALAGARGTALTMLRPSGTATIGTQRVDVVAEVDWIDAGTAVEVVRVDGFRVVVRPASRTPAGGAHAT